MRVVVYTADMGQHDEVHPFQEQNLPPGWEVTWDRFANEYPHGPRPPGIREGRDTRGWEHHGTRGLPEMTGWNGRLLARWVKCHPHILFPEADVTIWVDACLEITSPYFVLEAAQSVLPGAPYAAFRHPDREDIYAEAVAADTLRKYDGNRHAEMVEAYGSSLAHPVTGLWAMTVLVRRNHFGVRLIDHLVWSETLRWSTRQTTALDQIILPWVLDAVDDDLAELAAPAPPFPLPGYGGVGTLWSNGWFTRHDHRRET